MVRTTGTGTAGRGRETKDVETRGRDRASRSPLSVSFPLSNATTRAREIPRRRNLAFRLQISTTPIAFLPNLAIFASRETRIRNIPGISGIFASLPVRGAARNWPLSATRVKLPSSIIFQISPSHGRPASRAMAAEDRIEFREKRRARKREDSPRKISRKSPRVFVSGQREGRRETRKCVKVR